MVIVKNNVTDPVADLITRLRNANLARKDDTLVAASKLNTAVLQILEKEGYIGGWELVQEADSIHKGFKVRMKYGKDRERTITGLKRISKPGRRVYVGRDKLPRVLGGLGIAIISTPQGVMTDRQASRKGIGGEVLAHVW